MPRDGSEPMLLFTAFEPSGDNLAAAVVREIRERRPGLAVRAWAGPRTAEAGADLVETTTAAAEMGLPGPAKIREHLRLNRRMRAWLREHPPTLHVPVDSPAANFPICALTREVGARVVHLAAPQMWAWASWRIHKMKRLSDLVLCLLPFEPEWFESRGMPARFIGHPLFDRPLNGPALKEAARGFPAPEGGSGRIALLPGSRGAEWRRNFPLMLEILRGLRRDQPGAAAVVAAFDEQAERALREIAASHGGWPERTGVALRAVDAAAHWADVVVTVSGTATLQVARHGTPMVILFRLPAWQHWLVGRWVVGSHSATLPNLVAGRRIVPEFVPMTGGGAGPLREARRLLLDDEARRTTREALLEAVRPLEGRHAAGEAAEAILRVLDRGPPAKRG